MNKILRNIAFYCWWAWINVPTSEKALKMGLKPINNVPECLVKEIGAVSCWSHPDVGVAYRSNELLTKELLALNNH